MKRLFLFLSLFLFATMSAQAQFGLGKLKKALDTVTKISDLNITEEDEIALGEAISLKIRNVYGVQQDVEATRYVTLVGLALTRHTDRPDLPYQFIILDSNQINAFAAPGGFIHITRGALAAMKDESQLAGVLGHEIGHVTQQHTIKALKKSKGIELAEGQTSLAGNAAVLDKIAEKMTDAILAGFGRKEELESDEVGVQYAAQTGYDATGLTRFLEILKAANEGAQERAGLFASHPETQERIDKLEKQIAKESLQQAPPNLLAERYATQIKYQPASGAIEELQVEGAKGLASGGGKKEEPEQEEKPKKKSRFSLGGLKNPLSSGEKEQRAEVSGSGAARGVGKEGAEESGKPKNPNLVAFQVTPKDLAQFKADGHLK